MTRNLAQFIAGGYMVEGENKAVEAAGKLSLDDVEAALLREAPAPVRENNPGSFERFMGALGATGGKKRGE